MEVTLIENDSIKQEICKIVIEDLPLWFGVEETNEHYIRHIVKYVMFAVFDDSHHPLGFLSLRHHTLVTAEIYLFGVLQAYHHQGIGTMLVKAAEQYARDHNYHFITVKTIAEMMPNLEFEMARHFYNRIGFETMEIIVDHRPKLTLTKSLYQ